MAALVAHEPSLAITPRPMRGGGPTVDLDFHAASTRDVYQMLADVLRTNIVVVVPPTDLTLRVKRKPAGGVLAEVARATGAPPRPPGGGAAGDPRRRPGSPPPLAIRALDGPRSPADLLRDASVMCGAGLPVVLKLNEVATNTVLAIVAWTGGALRGPRARCRRWRRIRRRIWLLATVARGRTRLAAVELAGRAYLVTPGGAWEVGDGWIVHRGPSEGGKADRPRQDATAGAAWPVGPPALRRRSSTAARASDRRDRRRVPGLDPGAAGGHR